MRLTDLAEGIYFAVTGTALFLAFRLEDHHSRRPKGIRRVGRPVVPWRLAQGYVAAGWVGLGLLYFVAVVPEGLDAISSLLGVEEDFPKIVRAAVIPCSTFIWGITFTRRPTAIIWSRMLRPVCRDGVPPSQGR